MTEISKSLDEAIRVSEEAIFMQRHQMDILSNLLVAHLSEDVLLHISNITDQFNVLLGVTQNLRKLSLKLKSSSQKAEERKLELSGAKRSKVRVLAEEFMPRVPEFSKDKVENQDRQTAILGAKMESNLSCPVMFEQVVLDDTSNTISLVLMTDYPSHHSQAIRSLRNCSNALDNDLNGKRAIQECRNLQDSVMKNSECLLCNQIVNAKDKVIDDKMHRFHFNCIKDYLISKARPLRTGIC